MAAQFGALFDASGNRAEALDAIGGEVAAKQAGNTGAFGISVALPGGASITFAMSPGEMRRLMRGELPDDFAGTVNGQSVVGLAKRAFEAAAGKQGLAAMAGGDDAHLAAAIVQQLRELRAMRQGDAAETGDGAAAADRASGARVSLDDGTAITFAWFPGTRDQGAADRSTAAVPGSLDRLA